MRCRPSICSLLAVALGAVVLGGCDDGGGGAGGMDTGPAGADAAGADAEAPDAGPPDVGVPTVDLAALPYPNLSDYGFFVGSMADLVPATGVHPYQVVAPLWADHAGKARFIYLPPGTAIEVRGDEAWDLPVGAVVIKHFWYSADRRDPEGTATLIETRLLVRGPDGYEGHVYLWDEGHADATRMVAGKRVTLSFTDEAGEVTTQRYLLPNTNQCAQCHANDDRLGLLGVVSRQLDRAVEREGATLPQLDWLASRGVIAPGADFGDATRLVDPFGDAPVDRRARSYLDANCAHCHRAGGQGGPSGLVLQAAEQNPTRFGVCKAPVAAGPGAGARTADIVPGDPEASIMVYRMSSTDPEIKMPELPNLLSDDLGVDLIRTWIAGMTPPGCP